MEEKLMILIKLTVLRRISLKTYRLKSRHVQVVTKEFAAAFVEADFAAPDGVHS